MMGSNFGVCFVHISKASNGHTAAEPAEKSTSSVPIRNGDGEDRRKLSKVDAVKIVNIIHEAHNCYSIDKLATIDSIDQISRHDDCVDQKSIKVDIMSLASIHPEWQVRAHSS